MQPNRTALYLVVCEPLIVGRECDGLLLADEKVSRQHLRLSPGKDGVVVTDLGSTNGSFVDGVRVERNTTLGEGSILVLGDTAITVEPPPTGPRPGSRGTVINRSTAPPSSKAPAPPQLSTPDAPPQIPTPDAPPQMPTPDAPPRMPGGRVPVADTSGGSGAPADPIVRPTTTEGRRTSIDALAASLEGQAISLPRGSNDDTVTIVFSDIESSTELALSLGDQQWFETLTWHNELIEQLVAANGGSIVKNQGDGFMMTFNSARRAIVCASEIQQALARHPSGSIRVRIGMHTGEAIRQDSGDLFGRHVIIAARIGAAAIGGQILVSSIVREIASARGDLHFGSPITTELKGIGQQVIYPVNWTAG